MNEELCGVCFEPDPGLVTLPCHRTHCFHAKCLLSWLEKTNSEPKCPLCKRELDDSLINKLKGESVILEEELPENFEPTEDEIIEYAKWLGMDLEEDKDLFWVAREGLKAPLPENWKPCKTAEGEIYYFNFTNGDSVWDHPCDEYYKNLFAEEQKKKQERLAAKKEKKKTKTKTPGLSIQSDKGSASGDGFLATGAALGSLGKKPLPSPLTSLTPTTTSPAPFGHTPLPASSVSDKSNSSPDVISPMTRVALPSVVSEPSDNDAPVVSKKRRSLRDLTKGARLSPVGDDELSLLQAEHATSLAIIKKKIEEQRAAIQLEVDKKLKEAEADLQSEKDRKLKEARLIQDKEIEEEKLSQEKTKLEKAKTMEEDALKDHKRQLERAMEDRKRELDENIKKEMDEYVTSMRSKTDREKLDRQKKLQEQLEAETAAEIDRVDAQKRKLRAEMESKLASEREKQVRDAEQQLVARVEEEVLAAQKKRRSELEDALNSDIAKLEAESEARKAQRRQEVEESERKDREEHAARRAELDKRHKELLAALQAEQAKMDRVKTELGECEAKQRQAKAAQLAQAQNKARSAELESEQRLLEEQEEQLQQKRSKLQADIDNLAKTTKAFESAHEEELAAHTKEMESARRRFEEELSSLSLEHERKLRESREALQAKFTEDLEDLTRQHEDERKKRELTLKEKNELEVERLKERIEADAQRRTADLNAEFEKRMEAAKRQHEEAIEPKKAMAGSQDVEVLRLQEEQRLKREFDRLKHAHEAELLDFRGRLADELQSEVRSLKSKQATEVDEARAKEKQRHSSELSVLRVALAADLEAFRASASEQLTAAQASLVEGFDGEDEGVHESRDREWQAQLERDRTAIAQQRREAEQATQALQRKKEEVEARTRALVDKKRAVEEEREALEEKRARVERERRRAKEERELAVAASRRRVEAASSEEARRLIEEEARASALYEEKRKEHAAAIAEVEERRRVVEKESRELEERLKVHVDEEEDIMTSSGTEEQQQEERERLRARKLAWEREVEAEQQVVKERIDRVRQMESEQEAHFRRKKEDATREENLLAARRKAQRELEQDEWEREHQKLLKQKQTQQSQVLSAHDALRQEMFQRWEAEDAELADERQRARHDRRGFGNSGNQIQLLRAESSTSSPPTWSQTEPLAGRGTSPGQPRPASADRPHSAPSDQDYGALGHTGGSGDRLPQAGAQYYDRNRPRSVSPVDVGQHAPGHHHHQQQQQQQQQQQRESDDERGPYGGGGRGGAWGVAGLSASVGPRLEDGGHRGRGGSGHTTGYQSSDGGGRGALSDDELGEFGGARRARQQQQHQHQHQHHQEQQQHQQHHHQQQQQQHPLSSSTGAMVEEAAALLRESNRLVALQTQLTSHQQNVEQARQSHQSTTRSSHNFTADPNRGHPELKTSSKSKSRSRSANSGKPSRLPLERRVEAEAMQLSSCRRFVTQVKADIKRRKASLIGARQLWTSEYNSINALRGTPEYQVRRAYLKELKATLDQQALSLNNDVHQMLKVEEFLKLKERHVQSLASSARSRSKGSSATLDYSDDSIDQLQDQLAEAFSVLDVGAQNRISGSVDSRQPTASLASMLSPRQDHKNSRSNRDKLVFSSLTSSPSHGHTWQRPSSAAAAYDRPPLKPAFGNNDEVLQQCIASQKQQQMFVDAERRENVKAHIDRHSQWLHDFEDHVSARPRSAGRSSRY